MKPDDRLESSYHDPIVAEVRAARAQLLADAGGDLDALFRHLREREQTRNPQRLQEPPVDAHAGEAA